MPDNLTECPDWGKQVSRFALQCPSCGRPLTATTIEKTGKVFKAIQLVGFLVATVGLLGCLLALTSGRPITSLGLGVTSIAFAVVGFITCLVGNILAWWYQG
jgi:hypothetical protein